MAKKSIFKKLDDLCTKATLAIIGDIPHDGENQDTSNSESQNTSKSSEKTGITNTLLSAKEKFLNLGKPADESKLLYAEVVKREKQVAKEATKKKSVASKEPLNAKKTTPQKTTAKKSTTEKKKTVPTKTSTEKKASTSKKPTAAKTTTKKKTPTKTTASSQKTTTKKATEKPKATTSTTTKAKKTKGGKRAEKIALYKKHIKKHYGEVDEAFLTIVVKNLGPSIYKKDAELVSCSDPKELNYVRKHFLVKKLGIGASQGVLDAAIQDVCTELKSTRTKYRATFYYALAKKFKKESVLS